MAETPQPASANPGPSDAATPDREAVTPDQAPLSPDPAASPPGPAAPVALDLQSWDRPDPSRPMTPLAGTLPVAVVRRIGDWAQVVASNGWTGWVDARRLVPVPAPPPPPG